MLPGVSDEDVRRRRLTCTGGSFATRPRTAPGTLPSERPEDAPPWSWTPSACGLLPQTSAQGTKELLCFDCFAVHPHYHYRNATVQKNERLELDYMTEGDPLAWALDKIKHRLPAMLMRCEAELIARDLDQRDIDAALPKIAAWAEAKMRRIG
jgi:hypothetical protein